MYGDRREKIAGLQCAEEMPYLKSHPRRPFRLVLGLAC